MKYTSLITIVILAMTFGACDGRDRLHKTPQEVLHETKLLDSFSERVNYIPENYAEVLTDTILANGFHIKIKTFTDMENNLLDVTQTDSLTHKTFYRDVKSQVIISKNEKEIFNKIIDKSFFTQQYNNHEADLNRMTLRAVFVNQVPEFEKKELNEAQIEFYYQNIKQADYKRNYRLQIQPNGTYKISNFEN
ncbi:hypothetical protein SAMN04487989_1115 [Bizionia echini]|uniref:Uncharacterized protein n=1 Tax=Bizionia echini TaxID=649333 RepID=A0A1I5DR43_9FLAO|nr:hypothetical protein [Bizionia echini]SFO01735.1 hypothetical protein SAMN04487989_1115 [Bizionia echini]